MIQLRPPSAQKQYETYFSGDPAFVQPPAVPAVDATEAERAECKLALEQYLAKLKAARDTGDWKPLLIEGQSPTKFVLGQVDRNIWRTIVDRAQLPGDSPRFIGPGAMHAVLFRLAVKAIVGWEKFERNPDFNWEGWVMAPSDLVNQLDEIDPRIVGEVGGEVFARLRGVRPLS